MPNGNLIVTVGEAKSYEPGQTLTGKVTGTDVREWESADGDTILFFDIEIKDDELGWEFKPSYSAGPKEAPRITSESLLGQLAKRYGATLDVGEDLDLSEMFSKGTPVEFELYERTYTANGEQKTALDCDKETVRPPGGEPPESTQQTGLESNDDADVDADADGDEGDGDEGEIDAEVREQVLDYVREHEGQEERSVKMGVVQKGGDFLSTYKALAESGVIVSNGDGVHVSDDA